MRRQHGCFSFYPTLASLSVTTGKLLILIGVVSIGVGLMISYAPWLFTWFGKLPGDIRIEDKNRYIFIPITSMLLVSIIISLLINLFWRR